MTERGDESLDRRLDRIVTSIEAHDKRLDLHERKLSDLQLDDGIRREKEAGERREQTAALTRMNGRMEVIFGKDEMDQSSLVERFKPVEALAKNVKWLVLAIWTAFLSAVGAWAFNLISHAK